MAQAVAGGVERLRFRQAPLLAAAVCFALGEVLVRSGRPVGLLVVGFGLLAGIALGSMRTRVGLAPVLAVWIVTGMLASQVQPWPESAAPVLRFADGLSRTVRGRVVRVRMLPREVGPGKDKDVEAGAKWEFGQEPEGEARLSFDVALEQVEEVTPDVARMVPVEGGVRVTVKDDVRDEGVSAPALGCGDVVEMPLRLKAPERYRDPGAWQYADYLLEQGVGAHATVKASRVTRLSAGLGGWHCRVFAAQGWAAGRMLGFVRSDANRRLPRMLRLTDKDAGMLNAMLFGDRTRLDHGQREGFERTGTFHLFVVSGLHVALLAGGVFWLAKRLRVPEGLAVLTTLGVTSSFAVLTGFGEPVQRALGMTAVFLVARWMSRERSALNALGAAALGALVWSPRSLFEASFQMTFLVIVAIAGIAVPLGERSFVPFGRATRRLGETWLDVRMPRRIAHFRVMLRVWGEALAALVGRWGLRVPAGLARLAVWAAELALVGVVAEMVMALPMAMYFHRATVFALPANFLVAPLVALLAPLAVVTFVLALVSPWAAVVAGALTGAVLHGMTWAIGRMSHLASADMRVPGPAWWVGLAALACWGFCCWAVRRSASWSWVAVGVLPAVMAMILWPAQPRFHAGVLEVTAIDVGQGDSLLVVGADGRTMLVDAGGPVGMAGAGGGGGTGFDVGEEVVSPYLWSRQIRRLDVLALTHAHSDHMGGMAAVMRNFRPHEMWVGVDSHTESYQALMAEAAELGVTVRRWRANDAFLWGETGVEVLAPAAEYENEGDPRNNDSLVMELRFGRASALLEGDAEGPSESAMLAAGRLGPVTLLKVGHHGSRTSTGPEFFAAVMPRDAVVSVGRQNTFGHPRGEVIARIAAGGTKMFRTDEFGLTTFLLTREGAISELLDAR